MMKKDELNKVLLREGFEGRVTNVEDLLKYGAEKNAKNEFGSTPFSLAVTGNNIPVLDF